MRGKEEEEMTEGEGPRLGGGFDFSSLGSGSTHLKVIQGCCHVHIGRECCNRDHVRGDMGVLSEG